jgi:FKBP-type peptidyl-prolyl cis-trans isomerase
MKTIQSILVVAAAVMLVSCGGGSFQKSKSGLLYKIIADGKGPQIKPGNYIKFHIIVKQKDSVSYNSFGKIPAYTVLDSLGRPYDITEVLPKMKEGDSAVIVQLADSIAKMQMGQMPPGLKKGDKVTFMFRVVKVFTDLGAAQADVQKEMDDLKKREVKEVEAFVKSKGVKAIQTTNGVMAEIIDQGSGIKADTGKQVSVKYTGMNFEGKKFDSNVDTSFGHPEPLQFVLGQPGIAMGFQEAIMQLNKGGKIKAYIPSMLAYGMQGNPPAIKPYEHLIFEIEVLDVTDAPKQQAPVLPLPQQGGN